MNRNRAAVAVVAGAALALCAACSSSPAPSAPETHAAAPVAVEVTTPAPAPKPTHTAKPKVPERADSSTLRTQAQRNQFVRDMRAVVGTAGGLDAIDYLTIATTACDELKTTSPDREADRIAKGFTDNGIPSAVATDVAMSVLSVSITEVCPSHLDAYLAAFPATLGD